MRNKLIFFGSFILVLILIVVLLLNNPSGGNNGGVSNSPTPTPTTFQIINFSGFSSNVSLSNQSITNVSSIQIGGANTSVYSGSPVDSYYITSLLGLQKNPNLYIWQSSQAALQQLPDGSLNLVLNQTSRNGGISPADAVNALEAYLSTNLKIDQHSLFLTASKQGNVYNVSGTQGIGPNPVITLDGSPAVTAQVSTSGQVLNIHILHLFHAYSLVGSYPSSISSLNGVFNNYSVGVYEKGITDSQVIQNSSLSFSSYSPAYYYDSATGNLIPVLKLDANAVDNAGNKIGLTILGLSFDSKYVNQVVASPTPTTLNGYNPF